MKKKLPLFMTATLMLTITVRAADITSNEAPRYVK